MRKSLLALVALVFASAVAAAPAPPPVWPSQMGSAGSAFTTGAVPEGRWLAWTYTANKVPMVALVCVTSDYVVVHPVTTGLTPIKTAKAYWVANVTRDCFTDPLLAPILAGYRASRM